MVCEGFNDTNAISAFIWMDFLCNKSWLYLIIVLLSFYFWMPSDGNWISTESVLFFFLGGVLQKYEKIVEMQMPYKMIMGYAFLWVLYSFGFIPIENTYLHKINTILGLVIFGSWLICLQLNKVRSY